MKEELGKWVEDIVSQNTGKEKIQGEIIIGGDEQRLGIDAGDHGSCAYLGGKCSISTAIMGLSNLSISVVYPFPMESWSLIGVISVQYHLSSFLP